VNASAPRPAPDAPERAPVAPPGLPPPRRLCPARRIGLPGSGHVRSNRSSRPAPNVMRAALERRTVAYLACLALAVVCCACTGGGVSADPAGEAGQHGAVITVGSFDFPESVLLADLYAGALAAQGFPVRVLPDLGPRELVDPALMSGLVQVVPEYSGSALEFVSLGRLSATSDVTATGTALAGWVAGRGLAAGRPSAAQDGNVIVVTAATAARYGLRSVADLARVAPRLAFGGPPECPERVYCLLGLEQVYGLRFRVFIPLDAGGPLTLQALQAGDISVALLFSTDPAITADHLVVLADDRGLQPAENVVPLVRRDAVTRYGPRLLAVLDAVSARLTTGSLRALDAQVELRGDNPGSVARTWLSAQGLISAGGAAQ
jgi:osmoprotectant transport system substrate-binding protein